VALGWFAVEAVLASVLLALLPRDDARDALLPLYVRHAYDLVGSEKLSLGDRRMFFAQQLPLLVVVLLGAGGLARLALGRRPEPDPAGTRHSDLAPALFIGAIFYALAVATGYVRHAWHHYQLAWVHVLGATWTFDQLHGGRAARAACLGVALLVAPAFVLPLKVAFLNSPAPDVAPYKSPGGATLQLTAEERATVSELGSLIAEQRRARGGEPLILWIPSGAGYLALHDLPSPFRLVHWVPGFARARDERQIEDALPRLALVVLNGDRKEESPRAFLERTFSPELASAIMARFGTPPKPVGSGLVVLVASP
jgi:hypothetical protein